MNNMRVSVFAALAGIALSGCVSGDLLESAAKDDINQPIKTQQAAMTDAANDSAVASTEGLPGVEMGTVETDNVASDPAGPQTVDTLRTAPRTSELAYAPSAQPDGASPVLRAPVEDPQLNSAIIMDGGADTATEALAVPAVEGPSKTYLINGLMSAVPFIGYGFRNLSAKMPEAKLYSYLTPVEGAAAVYPEIMKDIEKAYRADSSVAVNLIGISLGADMASRIAEALDEKNIPVNYLGLVDGTNLRPINDNVRKADNLTCSNLDCTRARARLANGNTTTIFEKKVYRSSHIPLGDHAGLHDRVISQAASR